METPEKRVHAKEILGKEKLTTMAPCFYNLAIALRMEQKQTEACAVLNHCVLPTIQYLGKYNTIISLSFNSVLICLLNQVLGRIILLALLY